MVLANYADENGSCFPSQAQLALDTEMSERAVRDQLDFLECRGAFNRQASRQGNRRGRNRYNPFPACAGMNRREAGGN